MKIIGIYLLFINLFTFYLYGSDKRKAKKGNFRIPEKVLLLFAFVGGSIGAFVGMRVFRHKTKHWKFKILVPFFLIMQIAILVYLCIK